MIRFLVPAPMTLLEGEPYRGQNRGSCPAYRQCRRCSASPLRARRRPRPFACSCPSCCFPRCRHACRTPLPAPAQGDPLAAPAARARGISGQTESCLAVSVSRSSICRFPPLPKPARARLSRERNRVRTVQRAQSRAARGDWIRADSRRDRLRFCPMAHPTGSLIWAAARGCFALPPIARNSPQSGENRPRLPGLRAPQAIHCRR